MAMVGAVLGVVGGVVQGIGAKKSADAQAAAAEQDAAAKKMVALQNAKASKAEGDALGAQAEAVAEAHDYNAAVAIRNRDVIHEQTLAAISDATLVSRRERGEIRGQIANSGVAYTGSALDITMDKMKQDALNAARIRYKGDLGEIEQTDELNRERMAAKASRDAAVAYVARGNASEAAYQEQALAYTAQGKTASKAYKTAGSVAMVSGILGGVSSAVGTMTRTA
jgi:hypothetical protein